MGMGTIFGALAFGFIFAGMVVFATMIQHNMAEAAAEQQDWQQQQKTAEGAEIEITGTSYSYGATAVWTDTLYRDFEPGTFTDTVLRSDGTIQVNGTASSGQYTSQIIDTGYSSDYTTISWTSIEQFGGSVAFRVRTGATPAALLAASFLGPTGAPNPPYLFPGTALNETHDGDRYIQYQAEIVNSPGPAELHEVIIGIQRPTGHLFLNVSNSGQAKLDPLHTDVYVDGVRVERNSTKRLIFHEDEGEQALWNPDEELAITVFTAGIVPAQVTVSNNAATDSASVSP